MADMSTVPVRLSVTLSIGFVLLLFILYKEQSVIVQFSQCWLVSSTEPKRIDKTKFACLPELMRQAKLCLLNYQRNSDPVRWLIEATPNCSSYFKRALEAIPLQNKDELKFIVPPSDSKTSECTVVSLGIGNDIEAEKKLKGLMPQCKFYGADPILASGIVYKQIGTYVNAAVGNKKGNFTASVLQNGQYVKQTVGYMSMAEFFRMNQINFVDHLIMDAEGAEYELLPFLETFEMQNMSNTNGITVCQLNVELHLPLKEYGMNELQYNLILLKFLLSSDFLPLVGIFNTHVRMMFINLEPKCNEKYFRNICQKPST